MVKRWLGVTKQARGLLACVCCGWLVTQAGAGGVMSPVEIENLLPGNPPNEWDISGAGDPSIQGFATDISIDQGDTIHFKVDTDSDNYRIDIYRLGYYGGDGARLVDSVEPSAALPQAQPACAVDAGTNLVDCGTWAVSASWTAAGATSGVYLAKLVREDDVGASHILFVVRDDDGGSDILFQLADTTWQAYNQYTDGSLCGGSSLYPSPGGRASKVSYNRPSTTRTCVEEDSFFNSNYPMVRWLERNGYDVSYFSGVDSDRLGAEILEHRVFLSVGHDEYWSRAQRDNVTAARDALDPVHLAFFSGNEVYWKIRWEPSIDGAGTPYRTMVCYKEGTLGENVCGGKCDPLTDVWTGLWRDGCAFPLADGCEPENELTGQISWIGSTTAITVPAVYKTLPIWRNTDIEDLLPAETATLGTATLGYEWDPHQPAYDATAPPGLVWLSSTSSGGNTHHLTAYDAPSGAIVFGAGTVQWSWGLDSVHDRGSAPPDLRMQQMTVNLLADMGVEPGDLQGDLVPGSAPGPDLDPPVIVARSPANAAVGVPTTALVTATFDAPVAPGTITFELDSTLGPVPASVVYSSQTRTATLTPDSLLEYTETYTATVSGVEDLEGNPMASPDSWSFETAGPPACPCSVWGTTSPAGSASGDTAAVELGVKFRSASDGYALGVRFYKFPANTGTHVGHLWELDGTQLGEVTFTGETASGWQEALFATPIALTADTTYIVSYLAPVGRYAFDAFYFAGGGVENPPLRALADGEDGPNGVYVYGASGGFPSSSFNASNYWVDVLFDFTAEDETPPVVSARAPGSGAAGVSIAAAVTATFNEAVVESSINFQLLDGAVVVPAAFSYDAPSRTASLVPDSLLDYETTYTASISGVEDLTGNVMAGADQWSFATGSPPPPPPDEGPGGPILVIADAANPFGRYFAEILRAEGLNYFTVTDISLVTPAVLADHEVVILAEMPLSAGGVTMLSDWVTAGGKLIAMRPDAQLAGLLGLTPGGGTVAEGYLLIDTGSQPGQGLVAETIQYHGTANTYTLAGAAAVAALYADATTPAASPAVTLRAVGPNGGLAAAFAYDLARSVVYTRQGNPAWAGQERDANPPLRADDMFFPDWVNFDKIAIPQADEQQRLLANLILQMAGHPWPRFWYLPSMHKAAIIMTGDQHGCCGATETRFDTYVNQSPKGCSVDDWECVRASSYVYPGGGLSDAAALAWHTLGFELGIHCNTGCADWTNLQLDGFFASQLAVFAAQFPSLPPQDTERTHCGSWANWAGQPLVKVTQGIRLDTNYYYWPPSWIQNRPGMFTGSGMPMRFADTDGTIIDVYQAVTQMTDESGQTYPFTVDALLDKAIGPEGYYGAFCANMHTDSASHPSSDAIVASAQARGVPVVSGRQMLEWLDGRNSSTFSSVEWPGATLSSTLSFTVSVGVGANNLRGMIPATGAAGTLATLTRNGGAVAFTTQTIKGVQYAIFDAQPGDYAATFAPDTTPPVIANLDALPETDGTALITWDTDEASDSRVDYGTDPGDLSLIVSSGALVTSHSILLSGLAPGTNYYDRATSADAADNDATEPPAESAAATFLTPGPVCAEDIVMADFAAGSPGAATYVAETDDGEVILAPTVGAEFSGAALPPGWAGFDWGGGGAATVSGGEVLIDGARIRAANFYGPPRSVEFVATFGAAPFQGAGFAGGGDVGPGETFNTDPWAIFSTGSTGAALQARVNNGALIDFTIPGSFLSAPHRYRIDWNLGGFDFYIDGALVHSELVPIGATMRVAASDFQVGGPDLAVDWMRMSPYPAAGTFESRVFDGGGQVAWQAVTWSSDEPAGTSIDVLVRTGNTPAPDGSWTPYVAIPVSGGSAAATAQFFQYRADLATADDRVTAALLEVAVSCDLDDETAPLVVLEAPAPGASDVPVGADVSAAFSEQMTPSTINTLTFTLTPQAGGGATSATVSYNAGNLTATLDPDSDLAYGTPYDARVTMGAQDLAGIGLAADHVWSFTTEPPDLTAPAVIARSPSPGATGVPLGADVTATFSEDMNPSTIHALSFTLTPTGGGAVSASVTYDEPTRVATLDPNTDLDLATIYEVRVTIAAEDLAGNPLAADDLWTFMTQAPVCFTDDVVAGEFADGTPGAATYVAETVDGEVILAPTEGAEFFGTALPSGWETHVWNPGGLATVTGGTLTADGVRVMTTATYGPGRTQEFVATFGAAAFQHMGFGVDYNGPPYAMFSTFTTADTLFARTPGGGDTSLGLGYVGTPHLYKIIWNASSVEFHIDGALVATHNVAMADPMRPAASDFNTGGGALSLGWARMSPYSAAGSFESRVFDAGSVADWDVASWTSSEPAGTGILLLVRTGNTPVPDGSWSPYNAILFSSDPIGASSRYIQYRADLASALPDVTPQLQDVAIGCLIGPDESPPVISNIVAVPGAEGTAATITWDTDEPADSLVVFGTDPGSLVFGGADGSLVFAHEIELAALEPGTVYYYRVSSEDAAGNDATAPQPPAYLTFTTPDAQCALDDLTADFAAGSFGPGAYLAETGDGEVVLAPTEGAEFFGVALPAGWETHLWDPPDGAVTVGGGTATVDGARAMTTATYGPGRTLEFVATFGAGASQHMGFAVDYNAAPFAMFSTAGTTDTLFARVSGGPDTSLGLGYIGTPHHYKVVWRVSGDFEFYIDGALVATPAATIGALMRPAASDFNFGGAVLTLDWARMSSYAAAGAFESQVFDAGASVSWGEATWTSQEPAGTTLDISVRTGEVAVPDGSWTAFAPVLSSPDSVGQIGRYLQYRADLATTDPAATAILEDIELLCGSVNISPQAVDDQRSVVQGVSVEIDVLTNDDDPDGSLLPSTVTIAVPPLYGTTEVDPVTGAVTYDHDGTPVGTDSFEYTVEDNQAGTSNQAVVTLDVVNEVLLDISLRSVSASTTRCIRFELFDCGGGSTLVTAPIAFSGGEATGVRLEVPLGDYECMTAVDPLHTLLRRDDSFGIGDGIHYTADFTDQSGGGGDDQSLRGGNANGDPYVDIFDFGLFTGQWNMVYPPATCATLPPHADFSGNDLVFTEDFTFIALNFLQQGDATCCPAPSLGGGPVAVITVAELQARGMGQLAMADLNHDGWLDVLDMVAFLEGARPPRRGGGMGIHPQALLPRGDGGNWFDAGNWSRQTVPDGATEVTVAVPVLIDEEGAAADRVFIHDGGVLRMVSGSLSAATITVGRAGTFTVTGGSLGAGSLTVQSGGTLNVSGAASLLSVGSLILEPGAVLAWTGGTIEVDGGVFEQAEPDLIVGGSLPATLRLIGGAEAHIERDTLIGTHPRGLGAIEVEGGTLTTGRALVVGYGGEGLLRVSDGGAVSGAHVNVGLGALGTLRVLHGSEVLAPSVHVGGLGALRGSGTVRGGVLNDGEVHAGDRIGVLTIEGEYTHMDPGVLFIEMTGDDAGIAHGGLDVSGRAFLSGTLVLSNAGGPAPRAGDELAAVTANGITGRFDEAELAGLPAGLDWTVHYRDGEVACAVSIQGAGP